MPLVVGRSERPDYERHECKVCCGLHCDGHGLSIGVVGCLAAFVLIVCVLLYGLDVL